ncbi:MAG: LytTR family DNA-binding domain-containing protein [Maribacter sp.]|nr:LytTR family DNA-binding domain-containing protein [Maribacter sp.]MBT8314917.1 LytTR family DNA-binding domain-containing protein [Maribacter sp.]NNK18353.1 response regulator transcription factor [Maribacter sp.]
MTLNTIIVDDSETQRTIITKLVKEHPNLNLVGDYRNGILALNSIRKNKVELILLDVEMPIVSGFDLLESLEKPPIIILVSDKADYALKAFDYDITDYLQKPIAKARFNTAIGRVMTKQSNLTSIKEKEDYIIVSVNLQKKKLYPSTIKWIQAFGDYIKIVTEEGNFLVLSTMKAFLRKIPKNQFVRIHKSYIVNVNKVENWSANKVEISGTKLPMSRLRKDDLEKILIST